MKIDVLHSPSCRKCVRELPMLRAAAMAVEPAVQWFEVDIVDVIDYAVELGVLKPPAMAIDGKLVFTSLPDAAALTQAMRSRLRT